MFGGHIYQISVQPYILLRFSAKVEKDSKMRTMPMTMYVGHRTKGARKKVGNGDAPYLG